MERESREGWEVHVEKRPRADAIEVQTTLCPHSRHRIFLGDAVFLESTQSANMLHPLIIGIMTVNTSLTVIYWTFILGDAYIKWLSEPEDKPKKVVTPA